MFMLNPIAAGVMAAAAQEPPAPIGCSITLTGDAADLIGGQPMTISGQTASFIQTDPAQVFVASTNPESLFPPPESGNVSFEVTISVTGNQQMSGGLVDEALGTIAGVTCSSSGVKAVIGSGLSVPVAGNTVGFVLKSNGDIDAYDETGLVASVSGAYIAPGLFMFINSANAGVGETGSVHVKTAAPDFTLTTYPAGTLDWCGNEIPAPPAPDPYAWATLTTSSPEPTIDGRTWSLSTSGYKYASVEFAGPPPAFSGRRAFEIQPLVGAFPDTLSTVGLMLIRSGGTVSMRVRSSYGEYTVWGSVKGGAAKFEIPYVPGTSGALVVDGDTGDVEFWWDGVLWYTESGFFGTNWISAVVSEGVIGDFQTGTVGAKIPLYPAQYAGTYDGASALNGEPLGETEPLPEFTFTLSMFENGSIVNNPGGGAGWHNNYVPPSVITVDEPAPVMSTSELAAWVEAAVEAADAQDEIPDGTEIGVSFIWGKWERKPAFFKLGVSSFVYYETLAEALADVSAGDTLVVSVRTLNVTGSAYEDELGPQPAGFGERAGDYLEFEVSYFAPYALFTVGEPE